MNQYAALLGILLMGCLDARVGKPEYAASYRDREVGVIESPDAPRDTNTQNPDILLVPDIELEENRPPEIYFSENPIRIPEEFYLNFLFRAEDHDGDNVTIRLLTGPSPGGAGRGEYWFEQSGVGSSVTGAFTWTPGCAEAGTYHFDFEARDARGATAYATLEIIVEEACGECRDGERTFVSCSRPDSPCVGPSQERVCVNAQWQDGGECNGLIPIGEGQTVIDAQTDGTIVAYAAQEADREGVYNLFMHNLLDGRSKNVVGVALTPACEFHLLNFANDKILAQTCVDNFIVETSGAFRSYSIRDRNCLPNDELDLDRLACQGENSMWLSQFNRPEEPSQHLYNNICLPSRYPFAFAFSQQRIIFPSTNPGEAMDDCLPGWEGMYLLEATPRGGSPAFSVLPFTRAQERQYDFFPHFLGVLQADAVFFLRQQAGGTVHWMLHSYVSGATEEITPPELAQGRRSYQQGEVHASQNTVMVLDRAYNAADPAGRSKVLLYRRPDRDGAGLFGDYYLPVPALNEADLHCDIVRCTAVFRADNGNAYACPLGDEWR